MTSSCVPARPHTSFSVRAACDVGKHVDLRPGPPPACFSSSLSHMWLLFGSSVLTMLYFVLSADVVRQHLARSLSSWSGSTLSAIAATASPARRHVLLPLSLMSCCCVPLEEGPLLFSLCPLAYVLICVHHVRCSFASLTLRMGSAAWCVTSFHCLLHLTTHLQVLRMGRVHERLGDGSWRDFFMVVTDFDVSFYTSLPTTNSDLDHAIVSYPLLATRYVSGKRQIDANVKVSPYLPFPVSLCVLCFIH